MTLQELLESHPETGRISNTANECVDACYHCAAACELCADACLSEDKLAKLVRCIRSDLNCADICLTAGRVLIRHGGEVDEVTRDQLSACESVCRVCAEECEKHAEMHEHCRLCAEACRRCERACNALLNG